MIIIEKNKLFAIIYMKPQFVYIFIKFVILYKLLYANFLFANAHSLLMLRLN